MAKNQSTYTLKIDAELGGLQKTLNEAKNSLASFMASGNAPKGLEKAFEKINTLLGQISDRTGKPLDLKGLTGAGKDLNAVQESFSAIIRLLGEFDDLSDDLKLTFLSAEEQKKVTAITEALKAYGVAAEESAKKVKALEAAQKTLQKSEGGLGKARKKVGGIEAKKTTKEAELSGARGKLTAVQETGAGPEKIAQYQAKVTKLEAELTNLNSELAEANKELTAAQSAYDAAARSVQTLGNEAKKASKDSLHKLKEDAKNLGISLEGLNGHDATKQIEILTDRLEEFRKEALKNGKSTFDSMNKGFTQAGEAAENMEEEVARATDAVKGMDEAAAQRDAFEAKIKSFLGLSGAAQVLRAALRDAMQTITELDATMTEMSVVTDLTVGDYWDQLPEYSQRASELGVSINDAYKAATLYYQQGLKSNEVTAISAETLKLAKIAGIDAAEATDKMTAALRGFNMELNEASASKIADVYSELAAITAADVDEISTAMTKTASIASSAGMEFETTAAFLSQIIETTRESAETAGTAMKTVIARFQELKKDPKDIGEVEGEIVDANAIETALRSVGVSLRDANGQFRELDDVFLELSSKWSGLDKNTQRYIATIAAGSRQQSRFIAMMQDYGRTQELVTAANNSAGASQKQFEKTMDSLSAKVEKLKNAWHEFTMGIMDSDLVKFGVDILTKFLEIINKATDGINGFGGSLTKIVSVLGIFKLGSKIFEKFRQPLVSFFAEIVSESFKTGQKAAEQFAEGTKAGKKIANEKKEEKPIKLKEGYSIGKDGRVHRKNGTFAKDGEGVEEISWLSKNTGAGNLKKGINKLGNIRKARQNTANAQKRLTELQDNRKFSANLGASPKELAEMDAEINNASNSLEDFKNKQKEVEEGGKDAWGDIAQGVSQAGQAMVATGTAISMIGGLLSSLGLEQAGSILSDVGQGITMIGSALMVIPPILTLITAHPIIAAITAFLIIVLGSIIAISSYLKSMSADAQLEKATQDADAAAEAAENAANSYKELSDSLDGLKGKFDTLDDLRRGTKEWNEAVQDVNASVLELIDKYPELAGLIENRGGVLTLNLDSTEVQNVLAEAKKDELTAKSAAISAKQTVSDKRLLKDFGDLEAVDAVASARATNGAIQGAMIGQVVPILGPLIGTIGGAIAGGLIADSKTRNDEQLKKQTSKLAQAVLEGQVEAEEDTMRDFLVAQGMATHEAALMAEEFAHDTDALIAFGEATAASEAATKSYYQAMATNAQQMLNMGLYTEQQLDQMTNIVDEDLMAQYKQSYIDDYNRQQENSNGEDIEDEKLAFAQEVYGENARVEGNKILNEKGEVVRDFTNEEAFINEMAAAEATKKAAEAMEQIPGIINNSLKAFDKGLHDAIGKAFAGQDLTKGELEQFKTAMGDAYVSEEAQKAFDELSSEEQAKYENALDYAIKTGKADYKGIDEAWKQLTSDQQKFYGLTKTEGEDGYEEELEAAKEAYEATYTDTVKEQQELFINAEEKKNKTLGQSAKLSGKLSSKAAQAWMNGLEKLAPSGKEMGPLNDALSVMLNNLSAEQADAVMAHINAMDKMDLSAWEDLEYTFEQLGIHIPTSELETFTKAGIAASGAIRKIDFTNLHEQINNTYKLLDKVKEGGRTYSEEDYKQLISANKALGKSFTQIGDEFIYVGGSMDDLKEALEKNTTAVLQEANAQLKNKIEMGNIVKQQTIDGKFAAVDTMGEAELQDYLMHMRYALGSAGHDLGTLGIEGLDMNTSFMSASLEDLKKWAEAVAQLGANVKLYEEDFAENARKANIQVYSHNQASFNKDMIAKGGEYADEHAEALLLQAIQSGGVSNALIEQYRGMMDEYYAKVKAGDKDADKVLQDAAFQELAGQVAESTDKIIEANSGRDAYQELIDRVTDAIIDARQKEIDKLSEVNDSINSANDKLIGKLQEQINEERQRRQLDKDKQNLEDLYNQRAILAATGGSQTEIAEIDKQIADAEQSYQDTLVDQSIQNLQDANEKAAEQRERQITLLESQLEADQESGKIAEQASNTVAKSIEALKTGTTLEKSEMGKLLFGSETGSLSEFAKEGWTSKLLQAIALANNYVDESGKPKIGLTGEQDVDDGNGNPSLQQNERDRALSSMKNAVSQYASGSISQSVYGSAITDAKRAYTNAKGTDTAFNTALQTEINRVTSDSGGTAGAATAATDSFDEKEWDRVDVSVQTGENETKKVTVRVLGDYRENEEGWDGHSAIVDPTSTLHQAINRSIALDEGVESVTPSEGWVALYSGVPYIYRKVRDYNGDKPVWVRVDNNPKSRTDDSYAKLVGYLTLARKRKGLSGYKTGGLADFTGPAWLDGTKSRPEYVLNAAQTERFFSLVDVLEGIDTKSTDKKPTGDNYFDIAISVDKLENDYDVEQVADKIRRMIYEDATYRNVNAINHIR